MCASSTATEEQAGEGERVTEGAHGGTEGPEADDSRVTSSLIFVFPEIGDDFLSSVDAFSHLFIM